MLQLWDKSERRIGFVAPGGGLSANRTELRQASKLDSDSQSGLQQIRALTHL